MNWGYHSLVRRQTWGVTSLQSDLAWTIAGLCWSIARFPLARLWQADHSLSHILPSSPACLRSAGAPLPMISQALGIKSRTVWKDLQDEVEKHHPCSGHRKPPPLPPRCPSAVSLRSYLPFHSAFHTGLWDRSRQMTPWQLTVVTSCEKWCRESVFHYTDV